MVITATAPVRLDFAGGWTDVAPFATRERGLVINAAIDLRVSVHFEPGGAGFRLRSDDLDQTLELPTTADLVGDGRLHLLKAALRRSGLGGGALRTRSDTPPGSGLGSSGALDVALTAALDAARQITRTPEALAEEAFQLESVEAGLPCGRQDQYAAALGGFNRLTFDRGVVVREQLILEPEFAARLAEQIVICYTGVSRISSRAIERVVGAYDAGDLRVTGALRAMVGVAHEMGGALSGGDIERVGSLLSDNWHWQQELDPAMRTEEMAELEKAMLGAGALGGKAAGAGAGGSMFFVARDRAPAVRAAERSGARVLPCVWAVKGVIVEAGA